MQATEEKVKGNKMASNFHIEYKKRKGNLLITPKGTFDGSSACELINLLHREYSGTGQIFIETDNLENICDFACNVFCGKLNRRLVPAGSLVFRGENSKAIALNRSRL